MTPACENCRTPLPERLWNVDADLFCDFCAEPVQAWVFPAAFAPAEAARQTAIEDAAESSCFYHAESRAIAVCEGCGRFVCGLCELRVDGALICPSCLEHGVKAGKAKELESTRMMYDSMALHLTTWPVLLFWPTLFAAPAALFVLIRHWRTPSALMRKSRWRYWLAAVLAVIEVCAVLAMIGFIVWGVATQRSRAR